MVTADAYDELACELLLRHDVRVHAWRKTLSGAAWAVLYADGTSVNWIECPRPRSMIGLAILLHEIGHHRVGFYTYKRRCEEEFAAWHWSLGELRRLGLEPDARVLARVRRSIEYAVDKAVRRGLAIVPEPLRQYARAA